MDAIVKELLNMYITGVQDLDSGSAGKLASGIARNLVKDNARTLEDIERVRYALLEPERQNCIGKPTLEYCKSICDYLEELHCSESHQARAEVLISLAQCVAVGEPCGGSHRRIAQEILEETLELNLDPSKKAQAYLLLGRYYAGHKAEFGGKPCVLSYGASLDSRRSVDCYQKAIDLDSGQNSLIACYELGVLCNEGRDDLPRERDRALGLFERVLSSGRYDIKGINFIKIRYDIAVEMSNSCESLCAGETLRARSLFEQCIADLEKLPDSNQFDNICNAKISLAKLLFVCDESIVDTRRAENILLEMSELGHKFWLARVELLLGVLYSKERPGMKRQAKTAKLHFENALRLSDDVKVKGEAYLGLAGLQAEGAIHNYIGALDEVNKAIELGYLPALQKKLYYEAKLSNSLGSAGKAILGRILGG